MTGPINEEPSDTEESRNAAPMPPEAIYGNCPHCGTALSTSGTRQNNGDYGVCSTCLNTLIWDAGDWRMATYDETFQSDQDIRVRIMKTAFRPPLPGPGPNGEHDP